MAEPKGKDQRSVEDVLASSSMKSTTKYWWQRRDLLRLNVAIFLLIQLSSANGYDGSLINGLQALPTWQTFFSSPTGTWLGFIVAIQPLGQIIAYAPCAWLIQRNGRKAGIMAGYAWLLMGTILMAIAKNQVTWIVGRFFMGITTAFWFGSVPVLITEIAYPLHRGTCTSLWNTGWFVGGLLAAWITYGTSVHLLETSWAWRVPVLLQLGLPLVASLGIYLVPESSRWLVSRGRLEEARRVLATCHASGEEDNQLVNFEIQEIRVALQAEREAEITGYLAMLRSKGNRHRLFITVSLGILSQWNGVGIAQYYLIIVLKSAGVTSTTNQTLISGCLQIWNLLFAVSGAFLVDYVGRHRLFAISNISMLLCFIVITGCTAGFAEASNKAAGIAVIPFLFLYYGAYDIAYNPLQFAYTVEIWQYDLRARGLAVGLISTALAIFFNTFVNPIALEAIAWKYYFIYIGVLLLSTFVCWMYYPEAKGRTLEEIAVIFDGAVTETLPVAQSSPSSQNSNRQPQYLSSFEQK